MDPRRIRRIHSLGPSLHRLYRVYTIVYSLDVRRLVELRHNITKGDCLMRGSKSLRAAFTATSFFLLSALFAVFADVPDLTASMEGLCNPNATRWTASQPMARARP